MHVPRPKVPAFLIGGLTLLAAYLAVVYELPLVFWALGFMLSLLTVGFAAALSPWSRIRGRRRHPAEVIAGRPFDVTLTVESSRPVGFMMVQDELQKDPAAEPRRALVLSLRRRESVDIRYRATIARRGEAVIRKVSLSTEYPFGLFESRGEASIESTVLVLPRPRRLIRDVVEMKAAPQSEISVAIRGGLGEFHGVREYRPEDNPRWIHWRSSAKRGQRLVREFEREIDRRLVVILDASSKKPAAFESAVDLAATLLDHYGRDGHHVAIGVLGDTHGWLGFGEGVDHVRQGLRLLARAAPTSAPASTLDPRELRDAHVLRVVAGVSPAAWTAPVAAIAASFTTFDTAAMDLGSVMADGPL